MGMGDDADPVADLFEPDDGTTPFPPDHARGVRDRGRDSGTTDSVFERAVREVPEQWDHHVPGDVDGREDDDRLSAEEAAMHVDPLS